MVLRHLLCANSDPEEPDISSIAIWARGNSACRLISTKRYHGRVSEKKTMNSAFSRSHSKHSDEPIWRSTTILAVRHNGTVAIGGDGQVSYGNTIMKADTKKIRWMLDNKVIVGFAGSTADAFALLERFESKAKDYPGNITRAATEMARDWRTDRMLRRLEALMIVVSPDLTLLLTGQGDVVQPTDGIVGIGSGGQFAMSAARALVKHSKLSAAEIVRESLRIAAEIDVFTNDNIIVEELKCTK